MTLPPYLAALRAAAIQPEETAPVGTHIHDSPYSLALDLDDAEQHALDTVRRRAAVCPVCRGALDTLDYWLNALDHWSPRVGPEFETRHRLFGELFSSPELHDERLARARADEVFHHWGLSRLLLEESREAVPVALAYALDLAELAMAIAEHLDPEFYDSSNCADLRAETAAHLATVHRHRGDPEAAAHHLLAARTWLTAGSGRAHVAERLVLLESLTSSESSPQPTALRHRGPVQTADQASEPVLVAGPLRRLFRC